MAYDSGKNPFNSYEDDEDDFSAKSKYTVRDKYGAASDPFAFSEGGGNPTMSRYEHLQQQKENSMNNQLESTQRALASIYDSESMGVATAEELVRQGEQLDNVDNKLDHINQDMKTSQKHLNSIKSVFGGIKNWWRGEKSSQEIQPDKKGSQPSAKLQNAMDQSNDAGASSRSSHPAYRLKTEDGRGLYEDDDLDSKFLGGSSRGFDRDNIDRTCARAGAPPQKQQQAAIMKSGMATHDAKLEENLDLMSAGMSRLKGLAIGLGSEIERQNEQIDSITAKADRADIKLTDQNRQMRQILR